MNKPIKYSILTVVVLIVIFVIYSFLFGKLFPYSPVIIGFSPTETEQAVIYIQNGAEFTDFAMIDALFPPIEKFLDMKFKSKPRIFIFKDAENFYQRSLTKARFCSLYNGDVIIAPWSLEEAKRGEISLKIYLTHELTHSLIHQQIGLFKAAKFPKWLHEGTAMYSANQMGTTFYPSKEETYQYILNGNFIRPQDFHTKREKQTKLDVKYRIGFIYSEYACIVDYLVEQYGRDEFIKYVKTIIKTCNPDKAFKNTYGLEFDDSIKAFKEYVINQQ